MLAALLLGTAITTPVLAASEPANGEEMIAANEVYHGRDEKYDFTGAAGRSILLFYCLGKEL